MTSAVFHTLSDHSEQVQRRTVKADYLAGVLVIWASGISMQFFGFHTQPLARNLYWTITTLVTSACAAFSLSPSFRRPQDRRKRFMVYCLLAGSLFLSVMHGVLMNGYEEQDRRMGLSYFFGLAGFNFSAAVIYAARIPERWFPKTFDKVGASHSLMHLLLVCGAMSHLTGQTEALEYWAA